MIDCNAVVGYQAVFKDDVRFSGGNDGGVRYKEKCAQLFLRPSHIRGGNANFYNALRKVRLNRNLNRQLLFPVERIVLRLCAAVAPCDFRARLRKPLTAADIDAEYGSGFRMHGHAIDKRFGAQLRFGKYR